MRPSISPHVANALESTHSPETILARASYASVDFAPCRECLRKHAFAGDALLNADHRADSIPVNERNDEPRTGQKLGVAFKFGTGRCKVEDKEIIFNS